jgi:hypothetical protein
MGVDFIGAEACEMKYAQFESVLLYLEIGRESGVGIANTARVNVTHMMLVLI